LLYEYNNMVIYTKGLLEQASTKETAYTVTITAHMVNTVTSIAYYAPVQARITTKIAFFAHSITSNNLVTVIFFLPARSFVLTGLTYHGILRMISCI